MNKYDKGWNDALEAARHLALDKTDPPHLRFHVSIVELYELKKVSV